MGYKVMAGHVFTREELNTILSACRGFSLGQLDKNGVFERAKVERINGIAGNVVEQSILGYPQDSEQEADLIVDGSKVELKTTGLKKTKKAPHYAAKERMTITGVSPKKIIHESFENSHFWQKAENLLFVYYLYDADNTVKAEDYANFIFQDYQFHTFSGNDRLELQLEWEKIKSVYAAHQDDYKEVQARNELRGLDYLEVVAKKTNPRIAISQKYFNVIVRKFFGENFEPIIKERQKNTNTIEQTVLEMFAPYVCQSRTDLCKKFGVEIPKKNAKAVNPILARKMLNLEGDIQDTEEFQKANIAVKVLTAKKPKSKNKIKDVKTNESLKLQNYFDFSELMGEDWDDSRLRNYLFDTKFLLVVFEEVEGDQIFRGAKFWQMPISDLDGQVHETWERTRSILSSGVELTYKATNSKKGYEVSNNLPAMADNTILHVRPDAQLSSYEAHNKNARQLPTLAKWLNRPKGMEQELSDDWMTKQAFWLNANYMFTQISELFDWEC